MTETDHAGYDLNLGRVFFETNGLEGTVVFSMERGRLTPIQVSVFSRDGVYATKVRKVAWGRVIEDCRVRFLNTPAGQQMVRGSRPDLVESLNELQP